MSETEIISKLEEARKSANEALALVRHWRKLNEAQADEITTLRSQLDAMQTEKIEREFVNHQLDKRVQELEGLIETMWDEVKAELPQGMKRE